MNSASAPNSDAAPPELPADATPEQKDDYWYRNVYQGDQVPQLTLRAVIMGGVLGMAMSASNLYTTLAIGWAFGVAITACVMSFVIWNLVHLASNRRISQMSILENACMASTASAAGYATGSTVATMFGALLMMQTVPAGKTAKEISTWEVQPILVVAAFTLFTGLLGVFLAIPMKRQMINYEQLRFPSGTAAAETLRSLYSRGRDAMSKAYTLISGILAGAIIGILNTPKETLAILDRVVPVRLPELLPHSGFMKIHDKGLPYFGFEPSVLLIAAGIITRLRVSLSMFVGSALLYFWIGPYLVSQDVATPGSGWTTGPAGILVFDSAQALESVVRNIDLNGAGTILRFTNWSLWGGTAVMVVGSLAAMAVQWRTVARAFRSRTNGTGSTRSSDDQNLEVPFGWMVAGLVPITIVLLIIQTLAFDIAWWAGLIAVGMSFVLAMVASRATGETDTTPIGAMGKVMQLLFAFFHPGQVIPNLASAGVAANSAIGAADLLTDLKSGYLLGAHPRRQFLAQFFGVFCGTLAIVPAWYLMVPNLEVLEKFAAPSTRTWEAVARVLTRGFDYLPASAKWAIVLGSLAGIGLTLLERFAPRRLRPFVPSTMGLGLSWVIPFSSAFGFVIGAVVLWLWERIHRRNADNYGVPLASGLIAGESLVKALIAMSATVAGLYGAQKAAGQ